MLDKHYKRHKFLLVIKYKNNSGFRGDKYVMFIDLIVTVIQVSC